MKNKIFFYTVIFSTILTTNISCKSSKSKIDKSQDSITAIDQKSGVQLWGENCVRCHNAPPPQAYADVQWDIIKQHMRVKANISQKEMDKIIDFIKASN